MHQGRVTIAAFLLAACLASCGGETATEDARLHGIWHVAWERTLDGLVEEGERADAEAAFGQLGLGMEMEFSADTCRVRVHGQDRKGPWTVSAREGDVWRVTNASGDLVLSWLGDDAFRVVPGAGADTSGRGLVFVRQ